jgi:hypothetical protein
MRYVFAVLALVMAIFTALQYNDPDGPLWMLYYGVPTVWCGLAAFRPQAVSSQNGRLLLALCLVAAVALTIWYWPPVGGFWHEEIWRMSGAVQGAVIAEQAREGMGIMLATAVLLAVFAASFRGRRGIGPQSIGHLSG